MDRVRGAALVLVLWLVALLTALIGAFALNARVEYMQGQVLADGMVLQQDARAGLEYAISRLDGSPTQPGWQADGRAYRWRFDGVSVEIRIVDETGKVDLNVADVELLGALLRQLGVEAGRDVRVAGAIVDWRDSDDASPPGGGAESADYAAAGLPYPAKNRPFETLAELQRVLGVDEALYRKLLPNVTIYSRRSRPQTRFAPAPVLAAMGLDAQTVIAAREGASLPDGSQPAPVSQGSGTYSIESRARLEQGREAVVRAVVRTGASSLPGAAYSVLRWREGAGDR